MLRHGVWLTIVASLAGATLFAQDKATDWPQFRGPGGMGVSSAKGLPEKWGPDQNLIWKTALPGAGTSSPVIKGDHIYLTCFTGYNVPGKPRGEMENLRLHLLCLNRTSGAILWDTAIEPKLPESTAIRDNHGYASSTPAIDEDQIYVFYGKSGVCTFDLNGKLKWRVDVGSELNGWGSAASPVLFGDLVIINASVESQSLVALKKKNGDVAWRVDGIKEAWNTPVLVPTKDGKQELVVPIPGRVLGIDPATGNQLWSCNNEITWYIVPSVVAQDGVVWSIGGRSGVAAVALKTGGRGDVTRSHRMWIGHKGSNVSSPVIHDGHLYWMSDSQGVAFCANAETGKIIYEERLGRAGQVYASAVLADGRVYYVCRDGRTFVVEASPKYKLLSVNELGDRSTFNASPAISGNRIFLRSDHHLYCLGEK